MILRRGQIETQAETRGFNGLIGELRGETLGDLVGFPSYCEGNVKTIMVIYLW